jgi:hypothetical protein
VKIEKVESGQVLVALSPADCLLLAHACGATSDYYHDRIANPQANDTAAYTFDTLGYLLESYALLGDADGKVNNTGRFFDRNAIARAWGIVPGILSGAKGGAR